MSWIKTISPEAASGKLRDIYTRISSPGKRIDNILISHSLRPHTLEGHMQLYKNVLHHSSNELPKWFLESVGVYVSQLNNCSYCVEHHFAGLKKLLAPDTIRAEQIKEAFENDEPARCFEGKELLLLGYARKLTLSPGDMMPDDVALLQNKGIADGEILEVNQVTSYFCYANRTVLGLGTTTHGDELGLSPNNSDNPNDWYHT